MEWTAALLHLGPNVAAAADRRWGNLTSSLSFDYVRGNGLTIN